MRRAETSTEVRRCGNWLAAMGLMLLLGAFCLLLGFVPLRTAVQIGADEGFELAKATLCLHGHRLYTEVWNDQPPLHTFLLTQLLKHVSPSVLGPRLVTCGFAAVLLGSLFFIIRRVTGLATAGLMVAMLIASPGFLELSSSCMLEIPALATALAGLCVVVVWGRRRWWLADVAAGGLFGLTLEIKLISLVWTPLVALAVCLQAAGERETKRPASSAGNSGMALRDGTLLRSIVGTALSRACVGRLAVFGASLAGMAVAVDFAVADGAYLANFRQSWEAHFSTAQSLEYGSPAEHTFQWGVLLRHWDVSLLAGAGIGIGLVGVRQERWLWVPLTWLAWAFVVFTNHKPWWAYYYIHTAIPLCWCAALGITAIVKALGDARNQWRGKPGRNAAAKRTHFRIATGGLVLFAGLAAFWMGCRVYLQIVSMRALPRTFSSLAIAETARFKPFTRWLYTDDLVYSFHTDIPLPPPLAVVSLKRFWSGNLTRERVAGEFGRYRPELVLLGNNAAPVPFQDRLQQEYRLVYHDERLRLYARPAVIRQADAQPQPARVREPSPETPLLLWRGAH